MKSSHRHPYAKIVYSILSSGGLFFIILSAIFYYRKNHFNTIAKERKWEEISGSYSIDTQRTDLCYYRKNLDKFRNLTLSLKRDSSFQFSLNTPFIQDSFGKWDVGGADPEDWNILKYHNKETGFEQFDDVCQVRKNGKPGFDSILMINSVTPKKGFKSIAKLYFRKEY